MYCPAYQWINAVQQTSITLKLGYVHSQGTNKIINKTKYVQKILYLLLFQFLFYYQKDGKDDAVN